MFACPWKSIDSVITREVSTIQGMFRLIDPARISSNPTDRRTLPGYTLIKDCVFCRSHVPGDTILMRPKTTIPSPLGTKLVSGAVNLENCARDAVRTYRGSSNSRSKMHPGITSKYTCF